MSFMFATGRPFARYMRQRLGLAMACSAAIMLMLPRAEAVEPLLHSIVTDTSVPTCEQDAVIGTIRAKFDGVDANVSNLILYIDKIDLVTEAPPDANDPRSATRRYCEARATLTNGRKTKLYYLVEQGAGFVGTSWNVDFCLLGYEPWNVHDGRCHSIRNRWW